jgi:5'-nucleotidase
MQEKIIIPHENLLKLKEEKISKQGKEKFHIISDFDRTLTKAFVNGKKVPSIISELRNKNYISGDYSKKAHELFNKYHPIEINPSIPINEKKKKMREWWEEHFRLLIQSKLNKNHLEMIINSEGIKFREEILEFLDYLNELNIPLIILSSAGLGSDSITMFLEKYNKKYQNIYIISNSFEWDEEGNAIAIKEPIIHSYNKNEIIIKNYSVYEIIKNRKNVMLLGDSIEDIGMIEGFEYDNLIKIGFLNENIEKNLNEFKKNFDIVITNDGSMNYVNQILKEMFNKKRS